ncbi:MAG: AtpZ/AtpI family protein [Acidobacteriota bacterium]
MYKNKKDYPETVGKKELRKIRSRRKKDESLWFGLGMFGLVGWSVAIPTVIGIAVGIWIDARYPGRFSWTLICLFLGIILGCLNAWYWVNRERRQIEEERSDE